MLLVNHNKMNESTEEVVGMRLPTVEETVEENEETEDNIDDLEEGQLIVEEHPLDLSSSPLACDTDEIAHRRRVKCQQLLEESLPMLMEQLRDVEGMKNVNMSLSLTLHLQDDEDINVQLQRPDQEEEQRKRKRKGRTPVKFGTKRTKQVEETGGNEVQSQSAVATSVSQVWNPPSIMMFVEPWMLQQPSTLTPVSSPVKSPQNTGNHGGKLPLPPLRAATDKRQVKTVTGGSPVINKINNNDHRQHNNNNTSSAGNKSRKFNRQFNCQQCGQIFHALNSLTKHTLEVHGRFRCSDCGEAFTQKSNMERHFLKHQNFKPFRCGLCHKAYFRKDHASRHVETSHPGHESRLVVEKLDEQGKPSASRGTTPTKSEYDVNGTSLLDLPPVLTGEAAEQAAAAEIAATAAAAENSELDQNSQTD